MSSFIFILRETTFTTSLDSSFIAVLLVPECNSQLIVEIGSRADSKWLFFIPTKITFCYMTNVQKSKHKRLKKS